MTSFNQTLHILRKDVRHLLPEITVSLSLIALFAWIEPASWPGYLMKLPYPGAQFGAPQIIGGLLHLLIPLSWLIVISRLIHDESLVGDKQFWVTRPYTWYSLLLSKLLFLAVFLCLPLLLAQMFLFHYAGLPVLASLPGLLANLGMIVLFFLLPFTVLAAVTSSFGPLALVVLGGILYAGVVGLLATYLSGARAMPPYAGIIGLVLLGLILAGTLLYQYIERKTGLSQLILIATPVVVSIVLLLLPAGALFTHTYHATKSVSATFDLDPVKQQPTNGPLLHVNGNVVMAVPLVVSDPPETAVLSGKALQVELTSASGFHWSSPWQNLSDTVGGVGPIGVWIPQKVADRIGNETVKVRLVLTFARQELGAPKQFNLSETDYAVPGGVCSLVGDSGTAVPVCRYALKSPANLIETQAFDEPCPLGGGTPEDPPRPAETVVARQSSLYSFDPVLASSWRLTVRGESPDRPHLHSVCPGTPVKLTESHEVALESITVEQTGLELTPYLRHLEERKRHGFAFGPGAPTQ